jgi:hypothetical protein
VRLLKSQTSAHGLWKGKKRAGGQRDVERGPRHEGRRNPPVWSVWAAGNQDVTRQTPCPHLPTYHCTCSTSLSSSSSIHPNTITCSCTAVFCSLTYIKQPSISLSSMRFHASTSIGRSTSIPVPVSVSVSSSNLPRSTAIASLPSFIPPSGFTLAAFPFDFLLVCTK